MPWFSGTINQCAKLKEKPGMNIGHLRQTVWKLWERRCMHPMIVFGFPFCLWFTEEIVSENNRFLLNLGVSKRFTDGFLKRADLPEHWLNCNRYTKSQWRRWTPNHKTYFFILFLYPFFSLPVLVLASMILFHCFLREDLWQEWYHSGFFCIFV